MPRLVFNHLSTFAAVLPAQRRKGDEHHMHNSIYTSMAVSAASHKHLSLAARH